MNLLSSVKVLPTAMPSADDIASQIMKNQQLARTALQKARVCQTTTSQRDSKKDPNHSRQN